MKDSNPTLTAIVFAILSVALLYLTKELWGNIPLTANTMENLTVTCIIFIEYYLIIGFLISLTACKKKGFRNLKKTSEEGLINGIIDGSTFGLIIGLLWGSISGFIFWIIAGLLIGFIVGWETEFEKKKVQD